ncbi:MAG: esterase-like activity of phytase family protein, partial [Pirellulaceae bacterium]|nr:esterase-like activity of phytase family protein [Pirellulaceae bacterium]
RDGEAGELAKFKKLMLVSTKSATDITGVETLPAFEEAQGVQSIQKTVFIDLLDPKWKLAGEKMPEKIESLTFGPDLADGRRMLIVTSDNDFEADKPTYVYVFAIPQSAFRDALQ